MRSPSWNPWSFSPWGVEVSFPQSLWDGAPRSHAEEGFPAAVFGNSGRVCARRPSRAHRWSRPGAAQLGLPGRASVLQSPPRGTVGQGSPEAGRGPRRRGQQGGQWCHPVPPEMTSPDLFLLQPLSLPSVREKAAFCPWLFYPGPSLNVWETFAFLALPKHKPGCLPAGGWVQRGPGARSPGARGRVCSRSKEPSSGFRGCWERSVWRRVGPT